MDANGFFHSGINHHPDINHHDDINRISIVTLVFLALLLFLLGSSSAAHATLITFDELTQPPCDEFECLDGVVDNQYAALGVTFSGAGLYSFAASPQLVTPPNGVSDVYGPGMSIYFSGQLPTFVRLYVSSVNEDSVGIAAYGPGGAVGSVSTDGWRGTEENSTPYRDQQLITFSGSEISRLDLGTFYGRRGSLIIDNLEFSAVPLPGGLMLFGSGIAAFLVWRTRQR